MGHTLSDDRGNVRQRAPGPIHVETKVFDQVVEPVAYMCLKFMLFREGTSLVHSAHGKVQDIARDAPSGLATKRTWTDAESAVPALTASTFATARNQRLLRIRVGLQDTTIVRKRVHGGRRILGFPLISKDYGDAINRL